MEDMIIGGAGGCGREVAWLIERMNAVQNTYKIIGFADDVKPVDTKVGIYKVITTVKSLSLMKKKCNVCIAIGNSEIRYKIASTLQQNKNLFFPNIVDPSAIADESRMGVGNLIAARVCMTTGYTIENFCLINLSCTICHDSVLKSFVSLNPGIDVAGNVFIDECVEVGMGSSIIQGVVINGHSIVGAGATVIKDIDAYTVNVGVPSKTIKSRARLNK